MEPCNLLVVIGWISVRLWKKTGAGRLGVEAKGEAVAESVGGAKAEERAVKCKGKGKACGGGGVRACQSGGVG